MAIVGGLDIHHRQITFDYLDTMTGETCRGQLSPASRLEVHAWHSSRASRPGLRWRPRPAGGRSSRSSPARGSTRTWPSRPTPARCVAPSGAPRPTAPMPGICGSCCAPGPCPSRGCRQPTSPTRAPRSGCGTRWWVRGPAGISASTRSCSTMGCRTAPICSPATGGRGWPGSSFPWSPATPSTWRCG
jgi:hypothetical protein